MAPAQSLTWHIPALPKLSAQALSLHDICGGSCCASAVLAIHVPELLESTHLHISFLKGPLQLSGHHSLMGLRLLPWSQRGNKSSKQLMGVFYFSLVVQTVAALHWQLFVCAIGLADQSVTVQLNDAAAQQLNQQLKFT